MNIKYNCHIKRSQTVSLRDFTDLQSDHKSSLNITDADLLNQLLRDFFVPITRSLVIITSWINPLSSLGELSFAISKETDIQEYQL